jgi:hypothetical protein
MQELEKKLAFLTDSLVVDFKARLREKNIQDVNVRQEKHYENKGVQYIVEVIDLTYQEDEDSDYEDYGPTLLVTLDRLDGRWTLEFLIIRSYGPILHEKTIELDHEESIHQENIEILFKEIEDLLMDSLVTMYLK